MPKPLTDRIQAAKKRLKNPRTKAGAERHLRAIRQALQIRAFWRLGLSLSALQALFRSPPSLLARILRNACYYDPQWSACS